jgi:hypothetical protein
VIDEADEAAFWSGTGGDGNTQAVVPIDTNADSVPDRVLRYSGHNNFQFLQVYEFDSTGALVDASGTPITNPANFVRNIQLASGPGAAALSGLNGQDQNLSFDLIPMAVNANDPTRMVIGYFGIYESINTNINPTGGQTRVLPLDQIQQIDPAVGTNVPGGQVVTALVYGGSVGATDFDDVVVASRANQVLYRQNVGDAFTSRTIQGAGTIRDIVVDPADWKVVYAVDSRDVYRINDITDQGQQWVKITDNLRAIGQTGLRTVEYVEDTPRDFLLVGGIGGVSRLGDPGSAPGIEQWVRVGIGMPNVPVFDIEYLDLNVPGQISGGDRLIAGTLGRGVWSLTGPDTMLSFGDVSVLNIRHHAELRGRQRAEHHWFQRGRRPVHIRAQRRQPAPG